MPMEARVTSALVNGIKFFRFRLRTFWAKTKETSIVNTTYGPIKGVKRISILNEPYFSFEKIPFAKPPLNELRFCDPEPPEPWTRTVDCTREALPPVQINLLFKNFEGVEDCLYLNVYTKNTAPEILRPVMVWIYGGGFISGTTSKDLYSPDYLIQKDVILVSINYRVGPFGFLSLKDTSLNIPGNAGLKDQSLGLKWVKDNCQFFGGDPNNITIFGESAGAASTHYHLISDHSKDLFNRAILMSGTVLANWALCPPRDWAYRAAKSIGYRGENNDENVLEFLRGVKAADLAHTQDKILSEEERKDRIFFSFGPTIEPYVSKQCMIPKDPRIMCREAWGNKIPLMLGGNSFEGLFSYPDAKKNPKIFTELGDMQHLVPLDAEPDRESEKCRELGLRLKKCHFDKDQIDENDIMKYLDLLTYKSFWHSLHRTVKSRLEYANAPTYLYRFDIDSPTFNHVRILLCGRRMRGVCHADDLSYTFYNALTNLPKPNSKEYKNIQRVVTILTNFAINGDPNHEDIKDAHWNPVSKSDEVIKCLNISDELEIIELPENPKLAVWDSLYTKDKLF